MVGTTGVATALATGRFLAFLTAPGFLGGRSPELESESRTKQINEKKKKKVLVPESE